MLGCHINLRKTSGHWPGVPGTPSGTKRGLPAGVPGISCSLCYRFKNCHTRIILAGTSAGCPRLPATPGRPRRFSEILCDFSLCAFLLRSHSFRKPKTMPLLNHAFARVTPAIFVIFVVSRALSSITLVLLVRT